MKLQLVNDCIHDIYDDLLKYCNEKIASIVCDNIQKNVIINFLFYQIKAKNTPLLQMLHTVFKKYDSIREVLNNHMIDLLLSSFSDPNTFFEIILWFDEFGYNSNKLSENFIVEIYIQSTNYPVLKKYFYQMIKHFNNKNIVTSKTIFYIHDEVDIIKQYLPKDKNELNLIMIRCYQYDSLNTLKHIQYKYKMNFFDVQWYLLSPITFMDHIEDSNKNPFENITFAKAMTEYICTALRWDYLPLIINKLSLPMWQILTSYFYMGYLNKTFISVLFHQMKINNIPYTNLKSSSLKFIESTNKNYLVENNLYDIFTNHRGLIIKLPQLSEIALETSILSIPSMLIVFSQKRIDALSEIVFDSSLNLSIKYKYEIKYFDSLIETNQLGWDNEDLKLYSNFKLIMSRIIDEANLSYKLVNDYNSYLPLGKNQMPFTYQLRFINHFINTYNKITISLFKNKFKIILNSCIEMKKIFLINIRKETNTKLDPNIFFKLDENSDILDEFKDLIENCDSFDYNHEDINDSWVNELSDNKIIKNIVRNMLTKYHVPIQKIIPILYRHYANYATQEHFFLE
jgi:hypothetical protein